MKDKSFICEKPPEGVKLSGPEKGKLNKRNFDAYVKYLKNTGQKFPISQFGDINYSQIAELCGFDRQVFAKNKALKQQLHDEAKIIGTDAVEGKDPETRTDNELKNLKKQLSNARKDLALAEEKIEGLQKQLIQVNSELRRSEEDKEEAAESLDFMINTGRRFSL